MDKFYGAWATDLGPVVLDGSGNPVVPVAAAVVMIAVAFLIILKRGE